MQIVWTKQAQEDLEAIYRFWLPKNESYAVRIYNSFIDEAEILLSFPKAGMVEQQLMQEAQRFRRLVVGKYYKLIYTIEPEHIVIHAVCDCRQNPESLTAHFHK